MVFINSYTSELTEHFECIIQVLRETQASIIPNFRLRNQAYRGKWIAPHYRANECQSQVLQSFSHKIDCESHFILKVYQNICFTNRLLLCSFFFSTASLKCTHYSPRGFLAKKKKKLKPETSETLQTGCRNAATFVLLPAHHHKGLHVQVHLFHERGCSCLLAVIKCSSVASFLWPEKAK